MKTSSILLFQLRLNLQHPAPVITSLNPPRSPSPYILPLSLFECLSLNSDVPSQGILDLSSLSPPLLRNLISQLRPIPAVRTHFPAPTGLPIELRLLDQPALATRQQCAFRVPYSYTSSASFSRI